MSCPDGAIPILQEGYETAMRCVNGELVVFPASESLVGSDPQTAVTCSKEHGDPVIRQRCAGRRLPWHKPHAIELDQTTLASNPQSAIFGLCDREWRG